MYSGSLKKPSIPRYEQEIIEHRMRTLRKITTEQFAIIEEGFTDKGKISLNTSLRFASDAKMKVIAVFALFTFYSDQQPYIKIEAGCHFSIKDTAWKNMVDSVTNSLIVPRGFMSHLAMLTVGTTRGILHVKTESKCYNQFALPIINGLKLSRKMLNSALIVNNFIMTTDKSYDVKT